MTDKKEFIVNDKSLAAFLQKNGIKMVNVKNGKFVFEYDDSIDEKIVQFQKMQDRCLF